MSNRLTDEEVAFFKDNGYLLIKGALDLTLCAKAQDRLWASLPADSGLMRDDPTTHIGPIRAADSSDDATHLRQDYRWQLRDVGTESLMIDLVFNDRLVAIAEQLLGSGNLREPVVGGSVMGRHGPAWPDGPVDPALEVDGIRGIYCTLPRQPDKDGQIARLPDACHTDGHPFNLGIVGLLDDVEADGGAFKVWPRSHRRLYPTFAMQYDQPRIPYYPHLPSHKGILHSEAYLEEIAQVLADTDPVDCWGQAGDVVLWHHRLAHMAGHNYSNKIRQAVLYDFTTHDLDQNRLVPPQQNMWGDWSPTVKNNASRYSPELAQRQRLPDRIGVPTLS